METKETILRLLNQVTRYGIDDLITFIKESDYFTAPSSTMYHGNYDGGLADHCLNVYETFKHHVEEYKLNLSEESIIICSLLHDFCKINLYSKGQKWRKDANDKWESYETYITNDTLPLGHGEKSVIQIQRFITLTDEETLIIRHHMGGFNLDYAGLRLYNNACEICPSIVAFHTADYMSSKFKEKQI